MSRDRRLIAGFSALAVLAAGVVGQSPDIPVVSLDVTAGADGRVLGNYFYGDARQTAAFLPTLIPDLQVQDDWVMLAYDCLARQERP